MMDWQDFQRIFSDCELVDSKILIKSNLHDVLEFVSNDYSFSMLKEIIATDKKEEGIELIYHLYSTENEEDLFISYLAKGEAETVTDIFESAVADENEVHDLFGINFVGNKNQKRLYMPEDWKGHPLKKDYVQDDTRLAWNDNDKS